jgi:hypothetical protein
VNRILRISLTAVFNFLFGYIFQYMFVLFVLLYLYISEALGWTLDPTLEKGLLIPVLIATIVASLIYFSIIVFTNIFLWKKTQLKKSYFLLIILVTFSLGVLSNGERINILFS